MPRHSRLLQILVHFYSNQEIFIYIIYTKTPSPKKKQYTRSHCGIFFNNLLSKLWKKRSLQHTYTQFFFTLVCIQYCKRIFKTECTKFNFRKKLAIVPELFFHSTISTCTLCHLSFNSAVSHLHSTSKQRCPTGKRGWG